jgi:hypothetical protein
MGDYVNIVGDFIPVISGADIRPEDRTPLSDQEIKYFNATFEHCFRALNRYSPVQIVTQKHYDLAKFICEVVKKRLGDLPFTGDGTGGFGMRDIIPEDVYGTDTAPGQDTVWEIGNGIAPANWTVGAIATRFSRNDHGFAARNTLTGAAGTTAICRDVNNDMWYTLHWGLMDQMASGLVHGYWYYINNRIRAFKDITYQMNNSEQAYAELGYGVLYEPTVPYKSAAQIKPIDAAIGAAVTQQIALRPVGVTFATQRRMLTDTVAVTRPSAA